MDILIFNWRDITHPWAGGAEVHMHEIAKRWIKRGHKVVLFCGKYENCKEYDEIDGIKIVRKGGKYSVYIYAFLEYLIKFRKGCDIVIDNINGVPFFTPLYVRKTKIAILHHLVKDIFFKELPLLFGLIGYMAEWLIPTIYRKIHFITVSDSSKEEMIEEGIPAENITIIKNGVSKAYKPTFAKSSYPHIIYVGRLKRYKRLDYLIKAMKKVEEKVPDVKLSVVGTGEVSTEFKELTNELGLRESITFYGYVNEEEKIKLLQNAWLFVTTAEKEGFGLTVIEANACGTPAIAYDVPGLRDSIKHGKTGLLVESGNIKALSEVIITILEDEELREELSENALEYSKQFSWDESAVQVLNVLGDMMK